MDRMNFRKEVSKRAQTDNTHWPHLVGQPGVDAVSAKKAEKPSLNVWTEIEVNLNNK